MEIFISCVHLPPYLDMSLLVERRAWRSWVRQWFPFCSQNHFSCGLSVTLSPMSYVRWNGKGTVYEQTGAFLVRVINTCALLAPVLLFMHLVCLIQAPFLTSCWSKYLSECFVGIDCEMEPLRGSFTSARCSLHGAHACGTFQDEVLNNCWTSPFGSEKTPAGSYICHVLFAFRQLLLSGAFIFHSELHCG